MSGEICYILCHGGRVEKWQQQNIKHIPLEVKIPHSVLKVQGGRLLQLMIIFTTD